METLEKIRAAFAGAGREQPSEYSPLPEWHALPMEPREPRCLLLYGCGHLACRREGFDKVPRDQGVEPGMSAVRKRSRSRGERLACCLALISTELIAETHEQASATSNRLRQTLRH